MNNPYNPQSHLARWYQQLPGQLLAATEQSCLASILKKMVGYYLLCLGQPMPCLAQAAVRQVITVANEEQVSEGLVVQADNQLLPFQTDSLDVVLLAHVLEYTPDPVAVLEESWRILMPEGQIIIVGFNPLSLWGIWRLVKYNTQSMPWYGRFWTLAKMCRRLRQMNFELIQCRTDFFRPPLADSLWLKRLNFLEKLGRFCWPWWGAIYVIIAKKKLTTLTPIKLQWRWRDKLLGKRFVQPVARK